MWKYGPALNEVIIDERWDNVMAEYKEFIQVAPLREYRLQRLLLLENVISFLDEYLEPKKVVGEAKEATATDPSEEGNKEGRTSQAVSAQLENDSPLMISEPAELLEQKRLTPASDPDPSTEVNTSTVSGWLWLIYLCVILVIYYIFVVSFQTNVL